MERPYISLLSDNLLDLTNASTNADELFGILQEFQFRSTKRSRQVRLMIMDRRARLIEESFPWPTTAAPGGNGKLAEQNVFKYARGLLRYLGYRAGISGLVPEARKEILDWVYTKPLNFVINSPSYMREWGQPTSGPRLQKIANSLASYCQNAKRNNPQKFAVAIEDREDDLAYLKRKYYDGRYDSLFAWPLTDT